MPSCGAGVLRKKRYNRCAKRPDSGTGAFKTTKPCIHWNTRFTSLVQTVEQAVERQCQFGSRGTTDNHCPLLEELHLLSFMLLDDVASNTH